MRAHPLFHGALVVVLAATMSGCSIKKMAINTVGNALADSGSGFATDDDPELVAGAIPFGLKTIEGLLAQSPNHKGLLVAASSGFTQYAYAFVQQPADYIEAQDLDKATEMRVRAKKLFIRARDYGFRALNVGSPGFVDRLKKDPDAALAKLTKKDVPVMYYTGAAWAAAFALDITDASLVTDQGTIEKLMKRAIALDDTWNDGALHDFFISWEAAHSSGGAGGSMEEARKHFQRSREIAGTKRVSHVVSYAESVLVSDRNRKEFEALLNEAVKFDVEKGSPDQKLPNVLYVRRAKWLLSRVDELF